MIWIAYGVVTATLLGVAARALEVVLRGAGRPGRWVWLGAQALSIGLFTAALAGRTPFGWTLPVAAAAGSAPVGEGRAGAAVTTAAATLWLAGSVLALVLIAAEALRIRLRSRRWREGRLGGLPVLISGDVGPATLGLLWPRIVVPVWVFELGLRARRLIVLHEAEHRRSGDVRLLVAASLLAAAMPWNPGIWWQFGRLHRAVELDCDARVLRRVRDRRSYGRVLLEAGARSSGVGPLLAGLVPRRTLLEQRIAALTARPATPSLRSAWLVAGGVAFVAACVAPPPTGPDKGARSGVITEHPAGATMDGTPAGTFRFDSTRAAGVVRRIPPGEEGRPVFSAREHSAAERAGRRGEAVSSRTDIVTPDGQPQFGRVTRREESR